MTKSFDLDLICSWDVSIRSLPLEKYLIRLDANLKGDMSGHFRLFFSGFVSKLWALNLKSQLTEQQSSIGKISDT